MNRRILLGVMALGLLAGMAVYGLVSRTGEVGLHGMRIPWLTTISIKGGGRLGLNQHPTNKAPQFKGSASRRISPREEDESEMDNPDEALRWLRLAWLDENGNIPPDGLIKAMQARQENLKYWRSRAIESIASLTPSSWISRGPQNIGGRTRSLLIHPTNPNILWAGAVSGGIWKSTDGGTNWAPTNDFLQNLGANSLAMDPTNPNVIYCGTGEVFSGAGIFKTTDGGATWTQLPSTANWNTTGKDLVYRIAIAPTNSNLILAATRNSTGFCCSAGIFRSTDGGATWNQVFMGSTSYQVAFHPTDGDKAVAHINTDGGSLNSALYSTNGGANWTVATFNGAGTQLNGRIELAYAPSSPNIVYATVDDSGTEAGARIWRSTNGGQTFTVMTATPFSRQWFWNNTIWVDPTNANFLITGGVSLYKSTDGGATVTPIGQGGHVDEHAIVADPGFNGATNKRVYFCNDGGIFRTDDVYAASLSISNLNATYQTTQYYAAVGHGTSGLLVGGTQDNGVHRLLSGSLNTNVLTYCDGSFVAIDATDDRYLYGSCQQLTIFRSQNQGTSINDIYSGITDAGFSSSSTNFIAPFILDPNEPNRLLAGGSSLWRSNDAKTGNPPIWTAIRPPGSSFISAIAVAPGNSNIIWLAQNDGKIYKTTTGTTANPTWLVVDDNGTTNPLPARYPTRILIDPANSNKVYLAFGGFTDGNLQRTLDGGATWADVTGSGTASIPLVPIRGIARHPNNSNWLYVGTEVGVFSSEDGGATWAASNQGPANVSVQELSFMQNSTKLLAATYGRGLWTANVSCGFALSPTSQPFPASGGNNTLAVTAFNGCSWNAISQAPPWIIITAGASGTGNGIISYSVLPNSGPARAGTIMVEDQTFTINQASGCGTITINPTTLQAGTVGAVYNQMLTPTGGTAPHTFTVPAFTRFDATGPVAIPDNTLAGVDLPVTVSGISSPIAKVTVSLQISHTFDDDLKLQLISPDGTTVDLANRRGGNGANYGTACSPDSSRTTFDDASTTTIASGTAPFIGTFRPEQVLAAFNGKSGVAVNGTWKLHVADLAAYDIGTINCFSISITQNLPAPGLSFNSNGALSGIPTTAGMFSFTVTVTDANGCTVTHNYTLTINPPNNPPQITASGPLTRQQGSAGVVSTIATVSDIETPAGSLTVTATTVPAGLTVTSITNTNGVITANVAALCNATLGANTVVLTVIDGNSGTATANLTVNITANTAPTLTYSDQSVSASGTLTVNPATGPSDNGSISIIELLSQSTYTGTISVNNTMGIVSLSNAAPAGTHTITIRATDDCGEMTSALFTLTVDCVTSLTVNDLGDGVDATPGNGVCETATGNGLCTLRAAIQEANALTNCSPFTINLNVNGVINLASALPNLDHPDLTLNGPGANLLTVRRDGAGEYRIFTLNAVRTATLAALTIADGNVTGAGGGILNNGTLTVTGCHITGNTASSYGGGVENKGTLTVTNSTIVNNTTNANQAGGGIDNTGALTISNSTISGNLADAGGAGGGIFSFGGSATITNCTITDNQAAGANSSGGIRSENGQMTVRNNIIAANRNNTTVPDVSLTGTGTFSSTGFNLIGNVGAVTTFNQTGDQTGTGAMPLNPLLGPLANNGGATPAHALLPGSPAINAGTNTGAPAADQRGITRPQQTTTDIGAFESRGFTLAVAGGNNQSTLINTAFASPLVVAVSSANGEQVNGGRVSFTPPGAGASATLTGNPATISSGQASATATANGTQGGPYNVAANTNGAAAAVNFALTNTEVVNTPPTFTPAAALTRQQGSPAGTAVAVGTVADAQTAAGNLAVTQIAGGTATGITVTGITNTNGTITAMVSAGCTATAGTVRFQVADGSLTDTGDLQVNVTVNTPPTLVYPSSPSVTNNGSLNVTPTTATDNGSITGYGIISVVPPLNAAPTVNGSGVVAIGNANPPGNHVITVRATDHCGAATVVNFTLTVDCVTSLTVNDLGDGVDATPGNGVCETATGNGLCTLRAAIQEANALTNCSPFTINLNVNGVINLASALPNLDHPNLTLNGPGANLLTVRRDGAGDYRIFNIPATGLNIAISGLTIRDGRVSGFGGGIFSLGNLTLTNCVITNNEAVGTVGGGGVFLVGDGTFTNCTISNNTAGNHGGGLTYQGDGGHTLMLANCTISSNTAGTANAGGIGGGILHVSASDSSTLQATNCTIANNTAATSGGGGISTRAVGAIGNSATTILRNTIIANNTTPNLTALANPGLTATVTSLGNNLTSDNGSDYLTQATDLVDVNPLLGAFADNGGGKPTHALLPGSPAINAGTSTGAPATDQRGIARAGAIDIGAFESRGFTLAVAGGNNQPTLINTAFASPLSVTVSSTFGEPVSGGAVTFTPPGSGPSATVSGSPASINAAGQASVTATANGVSGAYQVAAAANGGNVVDFSLRNCPAITLSPATLPNGTLGAAYSQTITPSGGAAPYTFTSTGALPTGLTLAPGPAATTTLSGTPTTSGPFNFTVTATDANGCMGTRAYMLAINSAGLVINSVIPSAGRTAGGQQIRLTGAFANLSTVTIGGVSAPWSYTSDTSEVTVTTPPHAAGAVNIDLTPTSGNPYSKNNAFAYLPTTFTDNTLVVGVTTAKAQHIIELRQAVDALRAVAGLGLAPWTDPTLTPFNTSIKAVHILELRTYLDDAAARLGYSAGAYTDPGLSAGFQIKRIHIEELRHRIRAVAG